MIKNIPLPVRIALIVTVFMATIIIPKLFKTSPLVALHAETKILEHYLPDSTLIKLNTGSKLEYLKPYKGLFQVNGSSYITTKIVENPLTIICEGVSIKLYSNSIINIRGTEDEDEVEIHLIGGRAIVDLINQSGQSMIKLKSGQKASFDKKTNIFQSMTDTDLNITAWLTGNLVFQNNTIEELTTTIAKHYERSLKVNYPELLQCTFSGQYPIQNEPSQMLRSIAAQLGMQYEETGQSYILIGEQNTCAK